GAIAKALNYVYALCDNEQTRIHVVTMSMGGVASQAWADAINALYDRGVFVVTAGGNNYANLPTHNIVYPARFNRVVAACGVMANGKPYADLDPRLMAGNYGPSSKMKTAISAYTPNTPWARLGCAAIVDHDGAGTSAATPQVAAAAAIWIAKNQTAWKAYPENWMRAEAVRTALFKTAKTDEEKHFGKGLLQAKEALSVVPAAGALTAQPKDSADFAVLRILTGLGAAPPSSAQQRMLELEALQLAQTGEIEKILPDPQGPISVETARAVARALITDPRASEALRTTLAGALAQQPAPPSPGRRKKKTGDGTVTPPEPAHTPAPPGSSPLPGEFSAIQQQQLRTALNPPIEKPKRRKLQVYAYDPSLGTSLDTLGINLALLDVRWETLEPGPVGEYLEIVDADPASGACYAPVDLDDPHLLPQQGLAPTETDPRFHQQMAYAVASRTIEFFERALGRVALWAPRTPRLPGESERYVGRLRLYPHALRGANAYYSPDKKALLLGYFNASDSDPSENAPGSLVFTAISHDIVAHETTHALLDGLHRRYIEATNPDVLAFHEGFADIVALFQHFTMPEALKTQIARTRGDLGRQSLLGALAVQFGHATGNYGALRDAIGTCDENGVWHPHQPKTTDYTNATEPHDRGAVLVAAVFDAFLQLYRARTADLIRLATGGTGILGEGALPDDLTDRLAEEAATVARHCLEICIRGLDYCPPVDITFHDYLRAVITADRDIAQDDPLGYRVAFVSAFRARGISSLDVRSISSDSLAWEPPPLQIGRLADVLKKLRLDWDLKSNREHAYRASRHNAAIFHRWLVSDAVSDEELAMLGLVRHERPLTLNGVEGYLGPIEVHSVRPAHRIGPDRESRAELILEITQTWKDKLSAPDTIFRGGCTMIVDLEKSAALYLVRKRVDHAGRFAAQTSFQALTSLNPLRAN
ncbi:MAG TPA: S8 family serine peptidase, partial [Micropepsaceae bacterium]